MLHGNYCCSGHESWIVCFFFGISTNLASIEESDELFTVSEVNCTNANNCFKIKQCCPAVCNITLHKGKTHSMVTSYLLSITIMLHHQELWSNPFATGDAYMRICDENNRICIKLYASTMCQQYASQ